MLDSPSKKNDKKFLADLDHDDKEWQRRLAEGDTKSHAYSDGEIFWNIRECAKLASKQGEDEMNAYLAERRWWDQLSKRKQDFLKYLLKHPLLRSFDRLLFLPGIWRGFNIGVLDKLIALRCDEVSKVGICETVSKGNQEVSNYIEHIRKTWKTILKRNKTVARLIDPESVRLVQSRAPAASENDQRQIQFLMLKGILWPNIQDRSTRRKIKNQMEKIYWLIPTMHTLFEDIKYLKACQQAVKRLLPPLEGRTIYETARRAYENPHRGTFWVSYVRLWLFAMRNFATLTGATPRKERYGDDVSTDVSPFSWFQFAKEARTCGFATQSINEHLQQDPHMQTAEAILLKAKPSIAKDGTAEFKKYVERIADIVKASNTPPERTEPPTMFSTNSGEPIRRRCGRVYHKTYIKLQEHIDLAAIEEFQKANREQTQGYDITSLFVRQCVFNAFFGRLDLPISTPPTNSNGSPVPSPIETDTHENQLDEDHPMASPVERLQPTVSDADPSDRTEPRSATMLNHNCMLIDALPTMDTQEQLSTIDRQEHPSKIYTQEYPPTMDWQNQGSVIGNRDHPLAIATQEQLTSGNTQETTVVSQENLSTSLIRSHHYVGTADSGPEPAVSDQISMDNHDNITTNPIVDETTDHANTGATTHLYRRSHGRQRRDTLHRRREARSRTWGRRDEREAGSSRPRSPSRYRRHRSHYRDRRDESLRDVPRGGYSQPTQGAGSDATAVTNLQVVQFDPTHATQHDPGESNMVFHEEQISNAQNVTGAFAGLGSSFTFTGPFVTTHRSLDTETGIFGLTRTELAVPPASGYFQESSDAAAENPPWPISEVPQPISPLQRSSETFEYATNVTSTNHNVAGESSGRSAAIDPNIGTSRSQTFCTEREDGHQTPEHLDSHHADGSYREEAFLFENPEDDICEDAGSGQPEPDQERRQALAQDAQDAQDAPFITLQGVPATPGESSVQLNSPQNVDMAGALRRRRSSEGIRLEQSEEMDAAKRRKLEDKALVALRTVSAKSCT
ncbi:hypothetical protein SLS60_011930 [Paraconiothyrium brasiliense]|uniref:Uncharacterized protein n=1 Tax=Paraconiothyrium brasiliense TaxID=300254 RepID=A0ABR3QHM6_9PLEO